MDESINTLMARLEELVRNVHQYVGARYVPNFIDDPWNDITSYEAMDVVGNGTGTSYIAKKPVPVGTPLTNREFWFVYGSTSGAIINLQNQIDAITTKYENIKVKTPENFGAVGDGVEDDTAALQDCLNNCQIAVLNGTYYITSTVNVPMGVKIIGNGTIKTDSIIDYLELKGDNVVDGITFTDNLTPTGSSGNCIHALDTSSLTVTNCIFDTVGVGCCVLFEHCEHIIVDNNQFKDYGFSGVMLKATCKYASIQFNYLNNARYIGGQHSYPICFSGYELTEYGPAEYIKVNYNTIIASTPHWEGIDSHGAKDYEIIGNRIIGTLSGMNLGSTPTSIAVDYSDANHNCIIEDNYIDVATSDPNELPYGIQLSEQANCNSENVIIKNNYIKVNAADSNSTAVCSCISIRAGGGSKNTQICNNTFNAHNRHCISVDYGKHESLKVYNNKAESMSTDSSVYYFFNMDLITDYDNIDVVDNILASAFAGIYFFRGTTATPISGSKLIEIKGNDDKGLPSSRVNFSTYPDSALLPITKALGVAGQFKPNNASSTVAGWICKAAGNWIELSGTNA